MEMNNEMLFLLCNIVSLSFVLLLYRCLGKVGLFVWIAIATVMVNIEVLKCVTMFGLAMTLGNVLYGSTFLATDILSEQYGGKTARKAVLIGVACSVISTVIFQISLMFVPNEFDFASGAMKTIFSLAPRICISSLLCYYLSNTIDTYLYDFIRRSTGEKALWFRNNGSTLISQAIDSILFTLLAFGGMMPTSVLIELALSTYIAKALVAILDTPFMYMAKKIDKK